MWYLHPPVRLISSFSWSSHAFEAINSAGPHPWRRDQTLFTSLFIVYFETWRFPGRAVSSRLSKPLSWIRDYMRVYTLSLKHH